MQEEVRRAEMREAEIRRAEEKREKERREEIRENQRLRREERREMREEIHQAEMRLDELNNVIIKGNSLSQDQKDLKKELTSRINYKLQMMDEIMSKGKDEEKEGIPIIFNIDKL